MWRKYDVTCNPNLTKELTHHLHCCRGWNYSHLCWWNNWNRWILEDNCICNHSLDQYRFHCCYKGLFGTHQCWFHNCAQWILPRIHTDNHLLHPDNRGKTMSISNTYNLHSSIKLQILNCWIPFTYVSSINHIVIKACY